MTLVLANLARGGITVTVTFAGNYTRNMGQDPAVGTVDITPDGGSVSHQVPDGAGHISVALAGTRFTIVETFGSDVKTKVVSAVDGETINVSRDIGRVTGDAPTDEAVAAHQANTAAPAAVTSAAPAALTSAAVATADGSDAATTQALANALKAAYNLLRADVNTNRTERAAVQVDVAALRAEVATLTTDLNALLAKLVAAGAMAAS